MADADLMQLETAVKAARGLEAKVDALNALAFAARNRDPKRAKGCAEEAWRLARSAGYAAGIAWGNLLRGFTRKQSGKFVDAFTCGREALEGFRRLDDRRGEALALRFIGGIYVQLLELRKALDYYQHALVIFEGLRDPPEALITLVNSATILLDLGDASGALARLARGLKQSRSLKNREAEMQCLLGSGIACRHLDRPAAALHHYQSALKLAQAQRNGRRESEALILIGEHHLLQRRPRAAAPYYERALKLAQGSENLINQVNASHGLGEAALGCGEPGKAEQHFTEAIRLGRSSGNPDGKILGLTGLSGVRLVQDRREEAVALAKEALALAESGQYPDYVAAAKLRLAQAGKAGARRRA